MSGGMVLCQMPTTEYADFAQLCGLPLSLTSVVCVPRLWTGDRLQNACLRGLPILQSTLFSHQEQTVLSLKAAPSGSSLHSTSAVHHHGVPLVENFLSEV